MATTREALERWFMDLSASGARNAEYYRSAAGMLAAAAKLDPGLAREYWTRLLGMPATSDQSQKACRILASMGLGPDELDAARALVMTPGVLPSLIRALPRHAGALQVLLYAALGEGGEICRGKLIAALGHMDDPVAAARVVELCLRILSDNVGTRGGIPRRDAQAFVSEALTTLKGRPLEMLRVEAALRGVLDDPPADVLNAAIHLHDPLMFFPLLDLYRGVLDDGALALYWREYLLSMDEPGRQLPQTINPQLLAVAISRDDILPYYFRWPNPVAERAAMAWLDMEDLDRYERYMSQISQSAKGRMAEAWVLGVVRNSTRRVLQKKGDTRQLRQRFQEAVERMSKSAPDEKLRDTLRHEAVLFSHAAEGDLAARRALEPVEQLRAMARSWLASDDASTPADHYRVIGCVRSQLRDPAHSGLGTPPAWGEALDGVRALARDVEISEYLFSVRADVSSLDSAILQRHIEEGRPERAAELLRLRISSGGADRARSLLAAACGWYGIYDAHPEAPETEEMKRFRADCFRMVEEVWPTLEEGVQRSLANSRHSLVDPMDYDKEYVPWVLAHARDNLRAMRDGSAPAVATVAGDFARLIHANRLDVLAQVMHACPEAAPGTLAACLNTIRNLASPEQLEELTLHWPSVFARVAACEETAFTRATLRALRDEGASELRPGVFRILDHATRSPQRYLDTLQSEPREPDWDALDVPIPVLETGCASVQLELGTVDTDACVREVRVHLRILPKNGRQMRARCQSIHLDDADVGSATVWSWAEADEDAAPAPEGSLVCALRLHPDYLDARQLAGVDALRVSMALEQDGSPVVELAAVKLHLDGRSGKFRPADAPEGRHDPGEQLA